MQSLQITPKYINPPKESHWPDGSVRDGAGTLYVVRKEHLNLFQQGQPANISFVHGQGKYPRIISVNGYQLEPTGQQTVSPPPQQAPQMAQTPPPQVQKAPTQTPPLLSNVLAHVIEKGLVTTGNDLEEWARWVKEAEKAYHEGIVQQQVPPISANRMPIQPEDNIPTDHSQAPLEPY